MQQKVNSLFHEQISGWPLLGANWKHLDAAQLKSFDFDGFSINVQFNPKRITSSAAKVDRLSIQERPCFLCTSNRPEEEDFVAYGKDYEILCNPFPIFRQHYTIAHVDHRPQVIDSEFSSLLDLSRDLPELVVFYNAPSCGASAPDHMHFQAGLRGAMPIEYELEVLLKIHGKDLLQSEHFRLSSVDDGLRRFLVMEADRKEPMENAFSHISSFLRQLVNGEEPMLNILAMYRGKWQILIFPREKHRPWQFFEAGDRNILLSPASVDMGGLMITPLEKDFHKISRDDIADIFRQICLNVGHFNELQLIIKERLL